MLLARPSALQAFAEVEAELELLELSGYSPAAVEDVQARKLERLWRRAATTDYYAALAASGPPKLDRVPVTPKRVVRSQWKRFLVPEASTPDAENGRPLACLLPKSASAAETSRRDR